MGHAMHDATLRDLLKQLEHKKNIFNKLFNHLINRQVVISTAESLYSGEHWCIRNCPFH